MVDLVTFMANSTGTDVRSTHFSFIFKTYHEEVIKTLMFTLKKFRHEIPEIYRFVRLSDADEKVQWRKKYSDDVDDKTEACTIPSKKVSVFVPRQIFSSSPKKHFDFHLIPLPQLR